jgi:SAM-dependent methyltransferase
VSASDPATLAFYASEAGEYVTARPTELDPHLAEFLERLPTGASILELGCGGGRDAAHMIERGFAVHPTDGVAAMAAQAEAWLSRPVGVMRFDELMAVDAYDAIVANASLLHVPQGGLVDIFGRIWRALKPGGHHFASFKTGLVEGPDDHGRHYNHPSRNDLARLYRQGGDWSSLEIDAFMGMGYFSKPSAWLKIIVKKNMVGGRTGE